MQYTLDGLWSIDNNRAERAIKPFVIGRKNSLFSQTPARLSTTYIETAKANDLNVFEYVKACVETLNRPNVNIEQLLAWQFAKR